MFVVLCILFVFFLDRDSPCDSPYDDSQILRSSCRMSSNRINVPVPLFFHVSVLQFINNRKYSFGLYFNPSLKSN